MLEVRGLTRDYGTRRAVDGVSFSVSRGEVVGLLGPNGAGKTSTLRMLAGIIAPTAGSASIDGHDVVAHPLAARARLAFVPDEPRYFDYLTVEEHLRLMARLYGVADVEPHLQQLAAETTVGQRLDAFPGELSRGMRQELALACGLVHAPSALLLDEPLTGLDPLAIRRTKEVVRRAAAGGMAILLSSHLLHLVAELCERIVVLNHGRVVTEGTIEALAHERGLEGESLESLFVALLADERR
jgi:ABC-2 type transport system ATP-binding protein